MRALGPVGGGPNAKAELGQFVALMPESVYKLSSYDLRDAWMQFWEREFAGLYETDGNGDTPAVVESPSADDNAAALAEREAVAGATDPPPAAPADADLEGDTGQAAEVATAPGSEEAPPPPPVEAAQQYEGPCFACQGTGSVPGATDGEVARCNLCHGTGRLPAATTA